jgi:hypothetical protein
MVIIMNDIFYCYSKRMSLFLRSMKEEYIAVGENQKTNVKYWTFYKSERLDSLIELWNTIKNK